MLIARTLALSALLHAAVISIAALSPYISMGKPPGQEVMLVELTGGESAARAGKTSPTTPGVKPPTEGARNRGVGKTESPSPQKPESLGETKKVLSKSKQDIKTRDIKEKEEVDGGDTGDVPEKAKGAVEGVSMQEPTAKQPSSEGDEETSPVEIPREDVRATSLRGSGGLSGPTGGGSQGFQIEAVNSPSGVGGYEEDIISEIREAISRATSYPAPARQRRIEGTVVAGFFINSMGMPEDIRVLVSSGHVVLDREVVKIIKRAAPYPPLGADVEVPVSFRLLSPEGGD
jgi:TonB family protein